MLNKLISWRVGSQPLLAELLTECFLLLQAFAARLVRLKQLFTGASIQAIACMYPAILLQSAGDIEQRLQLLR